MAWQNYAISLRCSQCHATGIGHASDNDNGPNFSVDAVSKGFEHTHYSPNPWKQEFRHECGGSAEYELH